MAFMKRVFDLIGRLFPKEIGFVRQFDLKARWNNAVGKF